MRFLDLCAACENGEHRRCPDVAWRPGGDLRQCSCQGQCLPIVELGRRAERGLFRENTRSLNTLANLLWARDFSGREDVRFWEKRNAHAPAAPIPPAGPNPHRGPRPCGCPRCEEGVKRLLRDCGVLPTGTRHQKIRELGQLSQELGAYTPTRHRMDESDR